MRTVALRRRHRPSPRPLGATPSSPTRAVQAVEALVGQELISRTRCAVALTPAGESWYEIAKAALRQLQAGTEAVSAAPGLCRPARHRRKRPDRRGPARTAVLT
ncbi:MAG: LysR family transcriptional regulator [Alphaproteobacteria bacterium]|nr:LysR family transcriptional regulator [Alphaproteobacteria bacterium]